MKKYAIVALAVAALLSGCKNDDENKFDAKKAFKLNGAITAFAAGVAGEQTIATAWETGDAIGIFPEDAKTVATKSVGGTTAVKFTAQSAGASSLFNYGDYAFVADNTIAVHKFYGFYPYVENQSDPTALQFTVAALQTESAAGNTDHLKKVGPLYGYTTVSSPSDGATVRIDFAPVAAVLRVPVVTGENMANRMILTAKDDAPFLTAANAKLNMSTGEITVTEGSRSVELAVTAPLAASADAQYLFVGILPGNHTDKVLTAEVVTDAGRRTISFAGADFAAGKVYTLAEVPQGPEGYQIDLGQIKFDASYVYAVKNAEGATIATVAKEYLGKTANQQAVTVYGMTADGKIDTDNALVAQVLMSGAAEQYVTYSAVSATDKVHGGVFSFSTGAYTTEGQMEALENAYVSVNVDGSTNVYAEQPSKILTPTVAAETLTLSDRGDSYEYKLVKVGKHIWMAENLQTTKLPDGSAITIAATADEFKALSAANAETGCKPCYMVFNGNNYYNGYCAGKFPVSDEGFANKNTMDNVIAPNGWKVPTAGDFQALADFSTASTTLDTAGNNITLFSSVYVKRVTNGIFSETTAGTVYWSSSLGINKTAPKVRAYFCKITENNSTAAVGTASFTTLYNGFAIRLIKQ